MLKDFTTQIAVMVFLSVLVIGAGAYWRFGYSQDSVQLGLLETTKTAAISNADYSSRVEVGQLYIVKDKFEEDFMNKIEGNKNVNLSSKAVYTFDYLDNNNGSTKAIRVSVKDGEDNYSATYKLNVASQDGR